MADDAEAAVVAERLSSAGGDATSAVVVSNDGDIEPADFAAWITAAAERPEVAWIDTGDGRLRATGTVTVEPTALLVPPGDERAVVVLTVSPRSEEGQQAAADLVAIPVEGGPPVVEGTPINAAGVAGSRGPIIVAALVLAAEQKWNTQE